MNKDYNDFVERMTSFDLDLTAQEPGDINMRVSDSKPSLDTVLAHYGVKGMKWGVRRQNKDALNKAKASGSKEAVKQVKSKQKEARRGARSATLGRTAAAYSSEKGSTRRLVNAVLTSGTSVGYNLQRSAGYSVGSSVATTLLLGPLGNLAMAEYAARDGRAS